ncbi:MAG: hypothetical protein ABI673_02690 [Novosphingobium sp.]
MQFVAAFNALGYTINNQRQDWSAEKPDGVCISLWTKETDWKAMVMDSRIHAGAVELWGHKSGNTKRRKHARRALDEFDGWVDVVKVDGNPGEGYGNAAPWNPAERKGFRWRVTFLDDVSGHLKLEAQAG